MGTRSNAAIVAALLASWPANLSAATCAITNVTPLSFGNYKAGSAFPVDSTGEIDVTCTGPTTVQISMGRGVSGQQAPRRMTSLDSSLQYNLYIDAARTAIWGDGTQGTQTYASPAAMGQTLRIPIFGRVFALQEVPRGVYVDRVVVLVVF